MIEGGKRAVACAVGAGLLALVACAGLVLGAVALAIALQNKRTDRQNEQASLPGPAWLPYHLNDGRPVAG